MTIGFTLAEVFYPLRRSKRIAFTLAEVLITLGIIGVVAAMTMPALLANYQKQVLVTQLKKEYSAWSQAFQALLADEGVDKLSDTQVWAKMSSSGCNSSSTLYSGCADFLAGLQKYIKFQIPTERESNEYDTSSIMQSFLKMNSGAIVRYWGFSREPSIKTQDEIEAIKSLGGTMYSNAVLLLIDVNGYKKPNRTGRDVFCFLVSDEGRLYPYHGKDYAFYYSQIPLEGNGFHWANAGSGNAGCDTSVIDNKNRGYSIWGCAARIMENGWKMDY